VQLQQLHYSYNRSSSPVSVPARAQQLARGTLAGPHSRLPRIPQRQPACAHTSRTRCVKKDPDLTAAARLAGTTLYVGVCAVSGRGKEKRFRASLHRGMCNDGGGQVYSEDMDHGRCRGAPVHKPGCPIKDPRIVWVNQNQGGAGGSRRWKAARWCVYLLAVEYVLRPHAASCISWIFCVLRRIGKVLGVGVWHN
jgi:hypothetical protein